MNIKAATIYSVITQGLLKTIGFITVILLARLLTPEELGIFAIASTSIFVARELQNLGTINYLIRIKDIDKDIQRSCYGISLVISWSIGIFIYLSSDYIANIYGIKELAKVYRIFSITFFLTPFTIVPQAMLLRNMQFDRILIVALMNQVTTVTVTIWMVLNGFSYLGIAYGQLSGVIVVVIFIQLLSGHRSPLIPKFKDITRIINSGLSISVANAIERLSFMSGDLIIGKIGNVRDVALLSRSVGFIDFLKDIISMGVNPVVLPHLSKLNKKGESIADGYTQASYLLGSILLPVIAVAGVSGEPIIYLFFGPQWDESATLVPGIATWFLFKSIHILSPSLFIADAKEVVRLIKEVLIFSATAGIIILTYENGLPALSWYLASMGILDFLVTSIFLRKYTGLHLRTFNYLLIKNIIIVVLCSMGIMVFRSLTHFTDEEYLTEIMYIAFIATTIWSITIWGIKHSIYLEIVDMLTTK